MKLPKRYSDIDSTMVLNIEMNKYRRAQAEAQDLAEKIKDLVAEQAQRERDARREARK